MWKRLLKGGLVAGGTLGAYALTDYLTAGKTGFLGSPALKYGAGGVTGAILFTALTHTKKAS